MPRKPEPGEVREFFRSALWTHAIEPTLCSLRERNKEQLVGLRPSRESDFYHSAGLIQGRLAQIDATLDGLQDAVLGWLKENP
jgi:hypothetical protein